VDIDDTDATVGDEAMSSVQDRRLRQLSDGCRKFGDAVNKSLAEGVEIYYDDHMKSIYCLVGKAACTSWKRTLMMLTGKVTQILAPGTNISGNGARCPTIGQVHESYWFIT